jgi:hypothetical protein
MPYIDVDNMAGGVDRTRLRAASQAGTLWAGVDGHINRGGEFEVRKSFVEKYTLPAGTFGLAKTLAGLKVFGSGAAPAMPSGVSYQRLQQSALAMTKLRSWDLFAGKIYAIAEYSDASLRHFYDGTNVADWGLGGNNPVGYGTIAKTHKRKVYSSYDSLEWFSELDTPNNFDITASGSGFVNISSHLSGSDEVTGMGSYQQHLAILSRTVIQIWSMADDDAENAPAQFLEGTGTRSARSVVGFGDLDLFYLSESGIRSIRARVGTNLAGVNDVGTSIDTLVREHMKTLTDEQIESACAVVEPIDGRFWLALGGRVYVFSYFPSKKISAWTWYEPEMEFSDLVSYNGRVYARSGDTIYLYGGDDDATYDDSGAECALPFLWASKAASWKGWKAVDIAGSGVWTAKLLINPNNEDDYVDIGRLEGVTFNDDTISAVGQASHVAPVLTCERGPATISKVILHYDGSEAKA